MENEYIAPILVLLMLVFTWYTTTYSYWLVTIFGVLLLILMFKGHCICVAPARRTVRRARRRPAKRRTTRRRK